MGWFATRARMHRITPKNVRPLHSFISPSLPLVSSQPFFPTLSFYSPFNYEFPFNSYLHSFLCPNTDLVSAGLKATKLWSFLCKWKEIKEDRLGKSRGMKSWSTFERTFGGRRLCWALPDPLVTVVPCQRASLIDNEEANTPPPLPASLLFWLQRGVWQLIHNLSASLITLHTWHCVCMHLCVSLCACMAPTVAATTSLDNNIYQSLPPFFHFPSTISLSTS